MTNPLATLVATAISLFVVVLIFQYGVVPYLNSVTAAFEAIGR